jgi:3-oxocholest-4-en-26-oyl-CoA dehydrogenase beta subunit
MDFNLTESQEMLRTSARDFLKTYYPKSLVREMAKDEKGYTGDLWQKISNMGWTGMHIPEEYGGAGGSFLDLVVLLEEMGRACLLGPFFSTAVLGTLTMLEAGNNTIKKEYLPRLAEGKLFITLAVIEESGKYTRDDIKVNATPKGDSYVIQGKKLFVPDAHISNYIICATRTGAGDDGITLFLVDSKSQGLTVNLLNTISGDKLCEVVFNDVKVPALNMLGEFNKGWSALDRVLEKATLAQCAEMVGAARQQLELAVEYAKQRKAFNRPIGSFQAIQHYCSNMLVDADGCALVLYNAAWRLSEGLPATKEVSIAKALANEGFKRIASQSLQIHGAIGFTEDHDISLYYKQSKGWEFSQGNTFFHLDKLAAALQL